MTSILKKNSNIFFQCLEELKDERAIAFFRLASYTGARKGEILGLTWNDVDFEAKTIHFNKTLVELADGTLHLNPTKTESSNRRTKIDDDTVAIKKKWTRSVIKKIYLEVSG